MTPCSSPPPLCSPSSSSSSQPLLLPASTELVLEIQLNKLINDFLFAGQTPPLSAPPPQQNNAACTVQKSPPETASAMSPTPMTGTLVPENQNQGSSSPPQDQIWAMPHHASSQEDVRLTVFDSEADNSSPPSSASRLCKSYSEVGSLFCFAMESSPRVGEQGHEQQQEDNSSVKFSRLASLPCKQSINKNCRKPPRPPRSLSSEKAILILRSSSSVSSSVAAAAAASLSARRTTSEKRRKHSSSSSSVASTWALIFTFLFATAIIGEDLWSHNNNNRTSTVMQRSGAVKPIEDNNNAAHMHSYHVVSSPAHAEDSQALENLKILELRKQLPELGGLERPPEGRQVKARR